MPPGSHREAVFASFFASSVVGDCVDQISGTSSDQSAAMETGQEIDDGREEPKRVNRQQERQEASSLRARGAELAERLEAARTALASARERREFMEEEAEQVCTLAFTLVYAGLSGMRTATAI